MEKQVKIYALIDPFTLKVRYIGRTIISLSMRLSQHVHHAKKSDRRKTHRDNWILSLLKVNSKPYIRTLTIIEGWEKSHKFEQALICKYKHRLTNHDDRGDGGKNKNTTEEQKTAISNSLKKYFKTHSNPACIVVYAYHRDGSFYKEFPSIKIAALETGVGYGTITKYTGGILPGGHVPTKDGRKRILHNLYQFSKHKVDKMHDFSQQKKNKKNNLPSIIEIL